MKIAFLPLVVMLVVMLFVGSFVFGDVNQFEIETGLTVEALMFPDVISERTVELTGGVFAIKPFAEYAVAPSNLYTIMVIAVMAFMIMYWRYPTVPKSANAVLGTIQPKTGVRIFGPLLSGCGRFVSV